METSLEVNDVIQLGRFFLWAFYDELSSSWTGFVSSWEGITLHDLPACGKKSELIGAAGRWINANLEAEQSSAIRVVHVDARNQVVNVDLHDVADIALPGDAIIAIKPNIPPLNSPAFDLWLHEWYSWHDGTSHA
jgi:hypothetical protein